MAEKLNSVSGEHLINSVPSSRQRLMPVSISALSIISCVGGSLELL
jgi:hypothetical protein